VLYIGFLFEIPFRASILFFTVTYEYSLLLKKKDECVNSLHRFGNLFLFERIQQGYDWNPGISVHFGTSANHRIPFLNCMCSAARSFAGGCLNGVFQNLHHQNQAREEISIDGLSELSVFFGIEKIIIYFNFWM